MRLLLVGLLLGCTPRAAPEPEVPAVRVVELLPAEGQLQTLLLMEQTTARAEGRAAFVQLYADWCAPCVSLRNAMSDARMQEAFRGVHLVRLSFDAWQVPLRRMLPSPEAAPSVPAFFEVGPNGELGRSIDGTAWGEDVPENMAPVLRAYFDGVTAPAAPSADPEP